MSTEKPIRARDSAGTRARLLEAARGVIRAKGYGATTVDDICNAAGVSKGSFFHHFASKDALGVAAVGAFSAMANGVFGGAPFAKRADPRDRLLGYIDFRASLLEGELADYTCLMGTMVQEVHATHPELRDACDRAITSHVDDLVADIEAAKKRYAPSAKWTPESVGYFMQGVLQGAFILAKAKQSPEVARACLQHLRRYLATLLGEPRAQSKSKSKETKR